MLVPRILGLGLTRFTFGWTVLFSNIKYTFITAVVNSIDRSTGNRTSNRCLPFDGIGARHPGIVALSGHTPATNGNLVPVNSIMYPKEISALITGSIGEKGRATPSNDLVVMNCLEKLGDGKVRWKLAKKRVERMKRDGDWEMAIFRSDACVIGEFFKIPLFPVARTNPVDLTSIRYL